MERERVLSGGREVPADQPGDGRGMVDDGDHPHRWTARPRRVHGAGGTLSAGVQVGHPGDGRSALHDALAASPQLLAQLAEAGAAGCPAA